MKKIIITIVALIVGCFNITAQKNGQPWLDTDGKGLPSPFPEDLGFHDFRKFKVFA